MPLCAFVGTCKPLNVETPREFRFTRTDKDWADSQATTLKPHGDADVVKAADSVANGFFVYTGQCWENTCQSSNKIDMSRL